MKMLVAGVQRIAGTAKASGSPFDMCNVLALSPIEITNGKVQINGVGYKQMEIPLDVNALPQFMSIDPKKYPLVLDLDMEPRPRMGKVETVVVGIAAVSKAA